MLQRFLIKKYDGRIRATFAKSKMARIEADKDEGGIRITWMASNRSYLVRGGGKRRSREWLTTVSMLTKGIKVFEYVRLCQVSFLLRGHVLRFAQRATDTFAHFLDIRCLRATQARKSILKFQLEVLSIYLGIFFNWSKGSIKWFVELNAILEFLLIHLLLK